MCKNLTGKKNHKKDETKETKREIQIYENFNCHFNANYVWFLVMTSEIVTKICNWKITRVLNFKVKTFLKLQDKIEEFESDSMQCWKIEQTWKTYFDKYGSQKSTTTRWRTKGVKSEFDITTYVTSEIEAILGILAGPTLPFLNERKKTCHFEIGKFGGKFTGENTRLLTFN